MSDRRKNDPEALPAEVRVSRSCPPVALLRAWKEEALPEELARDLAAHTDTCPLCTTLLSDLERLHQHAIAATERERIRRTLPLVAPLARVTGWRWYSLGAAAAALVIGGILLIIRQTEHPNVAPVAMPETTATSMHSTEMAEAPIPQNQTPQTQVQAQPNSQLQIAKLDPPVQFSPALVLRGEASSSQPTAQQLAPAFDAYTRSDYALAAQRFSQLAKQFPRSGAPFLYLGVTQLLTNDNAQALFNLTRAEQFVSPAQKDAATFYRAVAALRTNAPNANELLHSVCTRTLSSYSKQACQLEQSHTTP